MAKSCKKARLMIVSAINHAYGKTDYCYWCTKRKEPMLTGWSKPVRQGVFIWYGSGRIK